MPLSNPFAQNYVDWKFGEPLFIEGGDPFDYSSGYEIDGLPVSEAEFNRRMQNGSAGVQVSVGGKPIVFVTNQRRLNVKQQEVLCVEARIDSLQVEQRSYKQSRANQQQ